MQSRRLKRRVGRPAARPLPGAKIIAYTISTQPSEQFECSISSSIEAKDGQAEGMNRPLKEAKVRYSECKSAGKRRSLNHKQIWPKE